MARLNNTGSGQVENAGTGSDDCHDVYLAYRKGHFGIGSGHRSKLGGVFSFLLSLFFRVLPPAVHTYGRGAEDPNMERQHG